MVLLFSHLMAEKVPIFFDNFFFEEGVFLFQRLD